MEDEDEDGAWGTYRSVQYEDTYTFLIRHTRIVLLRSLTYVTAHSLIDLQSLLCLGLVVL
jgi:hypothetical protein